jgi:hypothetical protein
MTNKDCSTPWKGIKKVFPNATLLHKGGRVTNFALGAHHIADAASGVRYALGLVTKSTATTTLISLSEAIARMARNPDAFLHLNNLKDHVNPVRARLLVYTAQAAKLDLVAKPASEDADDDKGWLPVKGSAVNAKSGTEWHDLTTSCLDTSGKLHIKGRLQVAGVKPVYSDLHYVIVDTKVTCP